MEDLVRNQELAAEAIEEHEVAQLVAHDPLDLGGRKRREDGPREDQVGFARKVGEARVELGAELRLVEGQRRRQLQPGADLIRLSVEGAVVLAVEPVGALQDLQARVVRVRVEELLRREPPPQLGLLGLEALADLFLVGERADVEHRRLL